MTVCQKHCFDNPDLGLFHRVSGLAHPPGCVCTPLCDPQELLQSASAIPSQFQSELTTPTMPLILGSCRLWMAWKTAKRRKWEKWKTNWKTDQLDRVKEWPENRFSREFRVKEWPENRFSREFSISSLYFQSISRPIFAPILLGVAFHLVIHVFPIAAFWQSSMPYRPGMIPMLSGIQRPLETLEQEIYPLQGWMGAIRSGRHLPGLPWASPKVIQQCALLEVLLHSWCS